LEEEGEEVVREEERIERKVFGRERNGGRKK
jgi:hypothetical protein